MNKSEVRKSPISVSFTEAEKSKIKELADSLGVSMGSYIRMKTLYNDNKEEK